MSPIVGDANLHYGLNADLDQSISTHLRKSSVRDVRKTYRALIKLAGADQLADIDQSGRHCSKWQTLIKVAEKRPGSGFSPTLINALPLGAGRTQRKPADPSRNQP